MDVQKPQTADSKYIQQHLANERTYLAWIRTALAFIGIGFLVTNLHLASTSLRQNISDEFAQGIGYASVVLGVVTIIFATLDYLNKGKAINTQTFKHPRFFIIFLSLFLTLIILYFGFYFMYLWN